MKPNYGPHQCLRSPQGASPVKNRRTSIARLLAAAGAVLIALLLAAPVTARPALAQEPAASANAGAGAGASSGTAAQTPSTPQTIYQIRVIGNRRIPRETILARLFTSAGDTLDPIQIERDFNSLWNTGYFQNLYFTREDTEKGIILNIFVKENPTIRDVTYKGLNSVTQSDLLAQYKKEKVDLTEESQYDPTKVSQAIDVIKEMLAQHGHQFATVKADVKTIPPASVQLVFNIKEGPVVKVGKIKFTGNTHISSLALRRAMRGLKPIGIPYSIIFENLFPQTYDSSKLEMDTELVRQAYRDKGYADAAVEQPITQIRNQGGLNWFTFRPNTGKRIDILLPIEEGSRYRLGTITFTGNNPRFNVRALRATFPIKDGDWFNATAIGKGLDNLKKAYGSDGYINFGAIPKLTYNDKKHTVSLNIDIDEGKQFYVSRIEFQGNTITRDRVIRRELLLQEGQVYNSELWKYSLLRLNQLQYFDPLKVDQDTEAIQDADNGTVELLLKVKEKGKNSIGMNGGISGLNGAFLGINYSTNNFLGLGETLSLQANLGNLSRQFLFGFTQPYVRNRPIQLGFQIFNQKTDYNAAKNYQATTGQSVNLTSAQQSLVQNYNQGSDGLNFSVSYPLKRHAFQRVGFTYSWTNSPITAFSTASQSFFQTIAFRSGIQGNNALSGIISSKVALSYVYNTVSDPIRPRGGKEYSADVQASGIWGSVRYVEPLVSYKQFFPMHYLRISPNGRNVLGVKAQLGYVAGWGGDVAPPQNRFYSGGENDLRGFDIRGATPYGYVPSRAYVQLTNPDGSCVPRDPTNPEEGQCIEVPLPVYGIASIGGDTNLTTNVEYRIPVVGPFDFSFFDDFGIDAALNHNQLKQSPEGFASLEAPLYGCPVFNNGACQGGIPGSKVGFQENIHPISGTNFVPRMSLGAQVSVMVPIINAPFRLYYAYNPLRLYETPYCNLKGTSYNQGSCSAQLITRDMFPPGGAGDFTYNEAVQGYGSRYL
ncbi:MAG: outer membrane protein assembly factor BamA, partial [Terracidiphilus sp.]